MRATTPDRVPVDARRRPVEENRRLRADHGFGLIEVLVAFLVLLLAVLPASLLIGNILAQSSNNRANVAAGQVAEQALESAHGVLSAAMTGSCAGTMPCSVTLADQVVAHITFHANLYFRWALIGNASADVCSSLIVPQVASAVATVTWGPGQHSLSESSIVNLPYTPVNLNDGFLAVQVDGVTNSAGAGQEANYGQKGVTVTVTADTGQKVAFPVTDSAGCAFGSVPGNLSAAAACPAGNAVCTNYTITLSPPAGATATYVDQSLNTSPSATITVAPTQVVGPPIFTYDKAATLSLTYPSVTGVGQGATCPLPSLCIATGQQAKLNPSYSTSAATFADQTKANNGTGVGGLSYDGAGPIGSSAVAFDGGTGYVQTATPVPAPGPQTFSIAAWFKTTTGGSIAGFTNAQGSSGGNYDRHLWIDPTGHVVFGVYPGSVVEVTSPNAYNDGKWHHVVAELSPAGMALYVDGAEVGSGTGATSAQNYGGWWHLGWSGAAQGGWADAPTSGFFSGSLGQMAIFPTALSSSQVGALAGATSTANYAAAVAADGASSYYPMTAFAVTGLGSGTPTAALTAYNGTSWKVVAPPAGLARLNAVSCPSATLCQGVGNTSSDAGMFVTASLAGGTWSLTASPTTAGTDLTSITCPSTTECLAVGYTLSGGTYTGQMLSFDGTSWTNVPTSGVTNLTSISCPTATNCIVIGTNGSTPEMYTFAPTVAPAVPTFTPVTLSPAPTALSAVSCPAPTATCFVTGTTSNATTAAAWSTPDNGATWANLGGVGSYTSLGAPACTNGPVCLFPADITSLTPSGTVLKVTPSAGNSWSAASAPASFPASQWISSVSCSAATCFAAGQGPFSADSPTPTLAETTTAGDSWTSVTVPGSASQLALAGIGCGNFGCVAVGESPTSDQFYSYQNASGNWTSDADPGTATGLIGLGFSASVANSLLPGGIRRVATSTPGLDPGPLNADLYPFLNGYAVFPGSCQAEASVPLPAVSPNPGGSATVSARLPDVSIDVVTSNGQPVPGATVSATATTTGPMAACTAETYTMPTTSADGISAAGFPLGTYTLTVNGVAVAAPVTLANQGVTYNNVTYPEPSSVVVVLP